ncbi:MAG TPA: hypothetical protein VNH20_00660 [Candidatus Dormibacteraeota bacterium]|nr:hypothetical protein [Candidatus Dormibacteraeota bacterium]
MNRFMASGRTPAATVVGVAAGLLGYWVGSHLGSAPNGDAGRLLGYVSGSLGFLIALGFASELVLRLRGRPRATNIQVAGRRGWPEYLGISLNHKVVAMQFAVGLAVLVIALVLIRFL